MVGRIASPEALHPVGWRDIGETAREGTWGDDVEISGGRLLALASVLLVAGVLFLTPPVVAMLVLAGLIR